MAAVLTTTGCGHGQKTEPAGLNANLGSGSAASAAPAAFVDVAGSSGIDYRWTIDAKRPLNILQTIGNGCALLDYDGDGNLDVLLVGPKVALFRGDGHGRFTNVTHATGLDRLHGSFLGCAVGDYDNDGFEDIYLTAYGGGALLHNEHGKTFTDMTKQAGIPAQPWGTSACFVDVDNDGKLDLLIGNYVQFDSKSRQLCALGPVQSACPPTYYPAAQCKLYRNLGGGRFADVSAAWNMTSASGKDLGVAFADFDGSGRQSIAVANDDMPENLLMNSGKRFADVAPARGTAFSASGDTVGGMGVDWGDYDNDGHLDLVIATFRQQSKCVYHNTGNTFSEQSAALGLSGPTAPNVAFGAKWIDYDNDGYLDLMFTNGHVQDNIGDIDKSTSYRQSIQLFKNKDGARFEDVSGSLAGGAARPIVGRGLAIGDFDNDGRVDALVVDSEGAPLLLHNETPNAGHWIAFNLIGTRSNRDAQGALVDVSAGGRKYLRECTTAGSYMSASDKRVHMGIGASPQADTVTVHWPSGHIDTYRGIDAGQIVTLREGDSRPLIKH